MAPTVPVSREVMTKFIIAFLNENPNIPYGEFTETLLAAMKEKGLCSSETKLATIIDAMVGLANTSDLNATVPALSETSTTSEAVDAPPVKTIKPPEVTPQNEVPQPVVETSGKEVNPSGITDQMINSVKIDAVINAAKDIQRDDKNNITWEGFYTVVHNHLKESNSDIPLKARAFVISELWSRYKEVKGTEDSEKAALQSVVQTSISPPDVTPGSETPVKAIKPPEVPFMAEVFDSAIYEHINKEVSKIIERCPGASNTEIQSTLREIQPPCAETSRALRKLSTFVLGKICNDARREYHRKKYNEPKGWPSIDHVRIEADGNSYSVVFTNGSEPAKTCPQITSAKKVRITPLSHHTWVASHLLNDSMVETLQISGQAGNPTMVDIHEYPSLKHLKNLKIGPYAECDGAIHFREPLPLKVFDVSELLDSPGDMSGVIAEKLVINLEQIRNVNDASHDENFKVDTVVVRVEEFDPLWDLKNPDSHSIWIGKRLISIAEDTQTRMRARNPAFRFVFQQRAKVFDENAKGHYVVALDEILYRRSGSSDVF